MITRIWVESASSRSAAYGELLALAEINQLNQILSIRNV